MHTTRQSSRASQRGMTLMELMVALAIGLIISLAIFQAMIAWNQRTRTTSSGGEAQVAGALGLYRVERDIQQAGLGYGVPPPAATNLTGTNISGCDILTPDTAFNFRLSAIRIDTAADASDPDVLSVLYGNSSYMTSGVTISGSTLETKQLVSRGGFNPGDWFVAFGRESSGTLRCRLLEMTGIPATGDNGRTVEHRATTTYNYYYERNLATPGARTSSANNTTVDWTGGFDTGWAYNLGPTPQLIQWSVGGGSAGNRYLRRSNLLAFSPTRVRTPTTEADIVQGVINLKAQYGVDANANSRIEDTEWTTTAPTDATRLLAIRVALLIRSQNFEPPVNNQCLYSAGGLATPRWFGTDFVMTNIGGAGGSPLNASDWRCYRYQVYERTVSLRNVIWGTTSPLP